MNCLRTVPYPKPLTPLISLISTSIQLRNVPVHITYDSVLYVIDTDRTVNQTIVTPRPSPTSSSPISSQPFTQIQERWSDRDQAGTRGTSVRTILGDDVAEETRWKEVSEAMEELARVPYPTMAEQGVTLKVFKPRSGR